MHQPIKSTFLALSMGLLTASTAMAGDPEPAQCDAAYTQQECLQIGSFMHTLAEYRDTSVGKANAARLLAERIDKAGRVGSNLTGHSTRLINTLADVVWELRPLSPDALAIYGMHYCDINFAFEQVGESVDVALSSLARDTLACQTGGKEEDEPAVLRNCVCNAATQARGALQQELDARELDS